MEVSGQFRAPTALLLG